MRRYLLLLLVLQQLLFACAACQLMSPTAYVDIQLKMQEKELHSASIEWKFNDLYTFELKRQYDFNNNEMLDSDEIAEIKKAMLDYLIPKNMLTKVSYDTQEAQTLLHPHFENYNIEIINDRLHFSYDVTFKQSIEKESGISFVFEDDENFFSFIVEKLDLNSSLFTTSQNLYLFTASLQFLEAEKAVVEKTAPKKETVKTKEESYLVTTIKKIKSLFEDIKKDASPLTYLFLLTFAFVYGIVHALGPGHGKSLVSSYFLAHDKSYSRAALIALAIGVVHTFSAFFLTLAIYYFTSTFLSVVVQDTLYVTTKISALIILAIAIYLMIKKYKFYKEQKTKPKFHFSAAPHPSSCGCGMCKAEEKAPTDLALIISAGIIPCPGTITLFIFSFSLGLYFAGFLAAFVMSLGMSGIIFASAVISVLVRKKTLQNNTTLKKVLEFASLGVIFILGMVLLLS